MEMFPAPSRGRFADDPVPPDGLKRGACGVKADRLANQPNSRKIVDPDVGGSSRERGGWRRRDAGADGRAGRPRDCPPGAVGADARVYDFLRPLAVRPHDADVKLCVCACQRRRASQRVGDARRRSSSIGKLGRAPGSGDVAAAAPFRLSAVIDIKGCGETGVDRMRRRIERRLLEVEGAGAAVKKQFVVVFCSGADAAGPRYVLREEG